VTARILIVCWTLFVGVAATALAAGEYQTTKNGKTMVWNSAPKPGDVATWNGDRDREGYATGFGTLTWYTSKGGSKPSVFAVYYGNMIRGKFEGPVNAHVKSKTAHAVFTDGVRTTRWAGGPAASFRVEQKAPAPEPRRVNEKVASRPTPKLAVSPKPLKPENTPPAARAEVRTEPSPTPAPPAVIAEKRVEDVPQQDIPAGTPAPELQTPPPPPAPSATPAPARPSIARKVPSVSPKQKIRDKYDDSLRALVGPPSSLRAGSIPDARPKVAPTAEPEPASTKAPPAPASVPASADAELAQDDVVELADAEAIAQGYDLGNYLPPKLDYSKAKQRWTVFFDAKPGSNEGAVKSLVVGVEDKTKRTFVASPK
jgi:hypothetical protein